MRSRVFSKLRYPFALAVTVILVAAAVSTSAASSGQNLITAIQDVAKKAIPSVVHIEVIEKQSVANPLLPFENDPYFRYFFGNPGKMPRSFQKEIKGLGSGILIDSEGHILTNNHVVNGATKMTVVLSDGRRYSNGSVRMIGVDAKTDLAVIQILGRGGFPYITFGDSDKVAVGQWVVAIGQPEGLSESVTHGIISAKHRRGITEPNTYQDFLQTDAAINPGNSGGPLLNLNGQVIGVNTAILSESGGFEGIGFAVPSNMAIHVARQLIANGRVRRGWLGLTIQNLTPELVHSTGVGSTKGVAVVDVLKHGPSYKAGIKRGDIILTYQGKAVEDPDSFRNEVASAPIGQFVVLTILRDGQSRQVKIKVSSDRQEGEALLAAVAGRFGIKVKPMGRDDAKRYGLDDIKGVVVSSVGRAGPFGKVGIESGDIILQINLKNFAGPDEFGEILSTTPPEKKIIFTVFNHRSREVSIVLVSAP